MILNRNKKRTRTSEIAPNPFVVMLCGGGVTLSSCFREVLVHFLVELKEVCK